MEMMKLKVATDRMKGYTGVLGPVRFTDGVSDEYLPRHIRDRMAAAMPFLEVDQNGNEQPAGAQNRSLREAGVQLSVGPLKRQSEADKSAEVATNAILVAKVPVVMTKEELEAVAEKDGIKGLREIGKKWAVKHRNISVLIDMILDAQDKAVIKRNKTEVPAVVEPEVVEEEANVAEDSTIDPAVAAEAVRLEAEARAEQDEMAKAAAIKEAAATGDLAAVINAETPQE
jgi:hypothetical protein